MGISSFGKSGEWECIADSVRVMGPGPGMDVVAAGYSALKLSSDLLNLSSSSI